MCYGVVELIGQALYTGLEEMRYEVFLGYNELYDRIYNEGRTHKLSPEGLPSRTHKIGPRLRKHSGSRWVGRHDEMLYRSSFF